MRNGPFCFAKARSSARWTHQCAPLTIPGKSVTRDYPCRFRGPADPPHSLETEIASQSEALASSDPRFARRTKRVLHHALSTTKQPNVIYSSSRDLFALRCRNPTTFIGRKSMKLPAVMAPATVTVNAIGREDAPPKTRANRPIVVDITIVARIEAKIGWANVHSLSFSGQRVRGRVTLPPILTSARVLAATGTLAPLRRHNHRQLEPEHPRPRQDQ